MLDISQFPLILLVFYGVEGGAYALKPPPPLSAPLSKRNLNNDSIPSKTPYSMLKPFNPLLHFVQPEGRLISSENLRFSASGGPLGGPPEPPSEIPAPIRWGVWTPRGPPDEKV